MGKRLALSTMVVVAPLCAQTGPVLSLADAVAIALKNHPRIAAARNTAAAQGQRVVEARSAYYPAIEGEITGSQGLDQSRLGAGALAASLLFNRFGAGIQVNQLITDLGRTRNLVASSRLQAQAAEANTQATGYDVILDVNRAYFAELEAQAEVKLAQETIQARQSVANQANALFTAQLKSQVDVSFAEVNLSGARLLLLSAQDAVKQADADLSRALGQDRAQEYRLTEAPAPPDPPADPAPLIEVAIQNRPELHELKLQADAARRFEQAEKDLRNPSVNLVGAGGALPYLNQNPRVAPDEYEAVAVNVEIPVFNGHLFSARAKAAHYETLASTERLRDLRQSVEHDVQVAWTNAVTSHQRIPVTEQLVKQAQLSLQLAQGRYNLGLASIVELSQAQLNLTTAQIANLDAKYQYQVAYAALQYQVGQLR